MKADPLEHQYVLYAAATHANLLELLVHWQPWRPDMEWSDMAVHLPALAGAITELASRGQIELFYGDVEGELGLVSPADVPSIVTDPANWWSPDQGTTPQTELVLTPEAGSVPVPELRPRAQTRSRK